MMRNEPMSLRGALPEASALRLRRADVPTEWFIAMLRHVVAIVEVPMPYGSAAQGHIRLMLAGGTESPLLIATAEEVTLWLRAYYELRCPHCFVQASPVTGLYCHELFCCGAGQPLTSQIDHDARGTP